ncbi:unnamed protein product [Oikopleura dioica]|uniref:Myosin tail domain-containing protein n=1 Tax=Oikopleura dioica TaxID=34765 RepID=E4XL29_OIKDI|nr:unnamed protein product [Oikopleura dioica]
MSSEKKQEKVLESRLLELEDELENERRRNHDSLKTAKKYERRVKESSLSNSDVKEQIARLAKEAEKLQNQAKKYQQCAKEQEEMANQYLKKYRKLQHELDEADERADLAENALLKIKAKSIRH